MFVTTVDGNGEQIFIPNRALYGRHISRGGGVSNFYPVIHSVNLSSEKLTRFSRWLWKFKHKGIQVRTGLVRSGASRKISGSRVRYFSEPQRGGGGGFGPEF